ncbi:MAG TPA: hypothetical protein VKT77_00115, partial [Chthonomonadaceae bacterium]|nr:hypothetical protein [Chthonomonadaceae bacterium]
MVKRKVLVLATLLLCLAAAAAYATLNNAQGFETNIGDWSPAPLVSRTPSGGGTLHLPAASGNFYAEVHNLDDDYQAPGYGDSGFSFYGGADSVYHGDFYQAIDVYIDANWAPAAAAGTPSFWIDMTPYHADPGNFGAEHNFRLTASGTSVGVTVDGQSAPTAIITNSGWYTFTMVYRKAANPSDPVITDMQIYDANHNLVGSNTRVFATSPGGPFASSDLRGNGYVWMTVWQNGFAGDVLGVDNVVTGLLPAQVKAEGQFDASSNPAAKDAKINVNASFKKGAPDGHVHYEDKAGNVMIEGDVSSITANGPASVTVGGVTKGKNGGVPFSVTLDGGANTVSVSIAAHDSVPAYSAMGTLEK